MGRLSRAAALRSACSARSRCLEHDRALAVGAGHQRALLAMLLLHANEIVSADRLVEALWGAMPPPTAAKTVQVYVSRLRKELGDGRLVTRAPGYALQVDRSELDLARFEQLVAEAQRPSRPRRRRAAARAGTVARARARRLRVRVVRPARDRAAGGAALGGARAADRGRSRLGRHGGARRRARCPRGRASAARAATGSAHARALPAGRQAEALSAYRQAQRELSEELGLEPSEELKRLEQAILRQDPELEPAR